MSKKIPKETTCLKTGAIIFEHIYSNNANERIAVVNTNPNHKELDELKYVYTSFAYPTRAAEYNKAGEHWAGNLSDIEVTCPSPM